MIDAAAPDGSTSPPIEQGRWRRNVALFLGGQSVSLIGSAVAQFAIFWHLTLETKSGWVLALATFFGFLPQAIVSVFGGVWADRHNRKFLIIGADLAIALTTLAFAFAFMAGYRHLWLFYAALTIRSIGAGIQTPAVSAMIPQIAPADQLLRVNGLFSSIQSLASVGAPVLAAGLLAVGGLESAFFLDVVTAVIGVGLLGLVPVGRVKRAADDHRGYFEDLVVGLRYAAGSRLLRFLIGYFALIMFLAVPPSFLTLLLVARKFGDDSWHLMANEVAFGVGMVLAGVFVAAAAKRFNNRLRLVAFGGLGLGVTTIALGVAPTFVLYLVLMFLCGMTVPLMNTPMFTILQEKVPAERQGRIFGLVMIIMAIALPVGMAIIGPIADHVKVEVLLWIGGVATIVASVWGLRQSVALADQVSAPVGEDEA
ncbi:MFS transporter [Rarobacter faecitabidus]|uniref:DHA3 family macrolide efflux protein-like MFS transporter n=1 Tax=Rarobacter faecitabidus TaxID=13243 RepID=A0A542ZPE4_RARFA|nr:MFS transporter [Rarobacter faecitabidus]TQL62228.1 DHA3 family macrolide efflux protein-like MFS transporter [Rarobacter faecitabidus]